MSAIDKLFDGLRDVEGFVDKVKHKTGITLTYTESAEILIDLYNKINQSEPERHVAECVTQPYDLVNLDKYTNKNKYLKARLTYLNYVHRLYESRGLREEMDEILPPYIVFPEQSYRVSHGDYSSIFRYFLSKLTETKLTEYFNKYQIPKGYRLKELYNE